jgi:antibiotic biosynthesis monooxygenase (ABM) superfamily enzyme
MNDVHTAVIARKIRHGRESDYERWLDKVATALHSALGHDGMTAISSPDPQGSVRTLLIRFVSAKALSDWEQSTTRHLLAEAGNGFSTAYYQTAPGLESFFSVPGSAPLPPRWKMCVLTIPAVYLLINVVLFVLLSIPGFAQRPAPIRMIPIICIMTVLLTYIFLPALSKLFAPWLFSNPMPSTKQTFEPLKSEGRIL